MKSKSIILSLYLFSCINKSKLGTVNSNSKPISVYGKHKNICRELKGKTVLHFIFVNEKSGKPWTNFEIDKTKSEIEKAKDWLLQQAFLDAVDLEIILNYTEKDSIVKPIEAKLKYESVNSHLFTYIDGVARLNKWSDKIATEANETLGKNHKLKMKEIKSRDGLIINLKNIYHTQNIALIYLINNPIRIESSVAMYTTTSYSNDKTSEYAIISEPNKASVIAHEILHLFGADDFYNLQFATIKLPKKHRKRLKQKYGKIITGVNNKTNLIREYPNSIMRRVNTEPISELSISPITKYLIGWRRESQLTARQKEFILKGDYIELE